MSQIDGLDEAVLKVRESANSLNKATDSIAKAVTSVEVFLNNVCSAGVYAHAMISQDNPRHGPPLYTALVYARVGGKFRIAVEEGDYSNDEVDRITAWVECSRDVKLESAKKLPELILMIAESLDRRIDEARETESTVSGVLAALTGKGA